MERTRFTPGAIAYAAYGQAVDYKNFRGEPMPHFDDLPEQIKEGWLVAAEAVLREYHDD
jgi:hypothetical protein